MQNVFVSHTLISFCLTVAKLMSALHWNDKATLYNQFSPHRKSIMGVKYLNIKSGVCREVLISFKDSSICLQSEMLKA